MPDTNFGTGCFGLRVALLRGLLGMALLLPADVWAGGHTIKVRPPNGVDDTANIQAALDAGVANGPGTTVQLGAGKYLTQQLATYNFHGTFKGMGKDKTTIEALPNLLVTPGLNFCSSPGLPNGTTNRWPSLVTFVDGDIRITDLAIKVTAASGTATTPWNMCGDFYTNLIDVLRFMGRYTSTNVWIENIAIEGSRDDTPNSLGYSAWNGVNYAGELGTPENGVNDQWMIYYYLSGKLTVRNSSFKTLADGVTNAGFCRDIQVLIGGSPSAGNVFEDLLAGIWFESAEHSSFEASYNRSEGQWGAMLVTDWLGDVFVPAKPSEFHIHDNTFITTGPYSSGIQLVDRTDKPWIRASIYNNNVDLKSDFMWDGIGAYNTRGTVIWNNTITGSGADAIGLGGSSHCTVIGNHVDHFFADPGFGLAKIYLDPATIQNLVVCANPLNTVLDQGTDNKIIGGWPQATAAAEALAMKAAPAAFPGRPNQLRRKPLFR
jgi:hypothetical protein